MTKSLTCEWATDKLVVEQGIKTAIGPAAKHVQETIASGCVVLGIRKLVVDPIRQIDAYTNLAAVKNESFAEASARIPAPQFTVREAILIICDLRKSTFVVLEYAAAMALAVLKTNDTVGLPFDARHADAASHHLFAMIQAPIT